MFIFFNKPVKKSFKVYVFFQIFIATAVIILINRQVSQYFLRSQLTQQIEANLVQDAVGCGHLMNDKEAFLICAFNQSGPTDITRSLIQTYVFCSASPSSTSLTSAVCEKLTETEEPVKTNHPNGRIGIVGKGNDQWYVARKNDNIPSNYLLAPASATLEMVVNVRGLRDRNLIYTLPFILLSIALLTFYLTQLLLKPVQSIKKTLTVLEPQHLDRATELNSPFYEFDDFLKIFDELRQRLQKSFTKARRFASDASHELRTPLTILRGHAEEMITELPMGSGTQIRMRVIADQVDHLIDISAKLLLLSQADANSIKLQLETLDLSQLVWNWAQDARSFDERIEIKHSIEPSLCCQGDRLLLLQVIHNFYTNAINYNIDKGWLRITLRKHDDHLLLCFENPSEMIPADFSSRAFDRFYRGPDALAKGINGYGLGLSLCQEIAKVHGGSIAIDATHNRVGITLCLPISA